MSVFHRGRSLRKFADTAAIFVHAGAGYHSVQNETVHLQACNDAALAAMAILRNGGSAVDAVEMAIKVLEDREITNAGYGSNLAIDGVVEGDAVVVDHFGRSGGCGAVAQIKNPISLARLVLDLSTQELTLRRVPPNLLVGQGATDFAFEQGMPVLPHDALVSPAAKERYNRWKVDLRNAEKKARQQLQSSSGTSIPSVAALSSGPAPDHDEKVKMQIRRDHTKAVNAGVWNEGQPLSPTASTGLRPQSVQSTASRASSLDSHATPNTPTTPASDPEDIFQHQSMRLTPETRDRGLLTKEALSILSGGKRATDAQDATRDVEDNMHDVHGANDEAKMSAVDDTVEISADLWERPEYITSAWHDGHSMSDEGSSSSDGTLRLPSLTPSPPTVSNIHAAMSANPTQALNTAVPTTSMLDRCIQEPPMLPPHPQLYNIPQDSTWREDCVTDTVGAIAIDNEGNIACGASSGGIGMKFRGRIGPAALVGVGAAVCPVDPEDKSRTCTGAVTSGTGEHMGTTLAASVCAERLYHGIKKRKGGGFEHAEDDQAVRSMIENDFMDHPSVKNSHSTGAIGVLAVKKTSHGAYLYFAHNTDSFALASMHADEPKPTCTMSRSHGNGMVAQGGRAIRYKRKW